MHVWQVWRVVGVGMAYAWRWRMVCYGVCRYGVQAYGSVGYAYIWRWRMVALGRRVVSLGVRCVYVVYIVL